MLDRNDLNKFGPPGFHLAQKEKDYVQHWVLSFLARSGFDGIFKGGTCLQKAFNLPRYSEDLDFNLTEKETGLDALCAYLSSAGFSGVEPEKKENPVSINIRLHYQGPLYNGTKISEGAITLNLSKREKTLLKAVPITINPPYPDLLPYQILIMDKDEIIAEKIRAIITRSSARDLFDLYFLFRLGGKFNRNLVETKLSFYKIKFDVKSAIKNIKKLKTIWAKEITALTPAQLEYELISEEVIKRLVH